MQRLPIELVAEISMYDVQTWGRMLFVFRGLSAARFTFVAQKKFIRVVNKLGKHRTYVGGLLHSIGSGRPSAIDSYVDGERMTVVLPHIPWGYFRGRKPLPSWIPRVDGRRVRISCQVYLCDLRKEKRQLYSRFVSAAVWCWNNLRDATNENKCTRHARAYHKSGAKDPQEREAYCEVYLDRTRGTDRTHLSRRIGPKRVVVCITRENNEIRCELVEDHACTMTAHFAP